jgi:hypothetical protein
MKSRRLIFVLVALVVSAFAEDKKSVPLADVAQHAVEQSKLTQSGSAAFHLKMTIVETTNPKSEYQGVIEEYWISPHKWRREITSPGFSQTLIVNGDKISEQNKGDYFPWWLNDLVTAAFDLVPMLDQLKGVNASMPPPSGSGHSTSCSRLQTKVGIPPAQNSVFLVFCFEGSHGLLDSIVTPGYEADFKDYRSFQSKRVASRIVIDPEPGTTIEAKIAELADLNAIDDSMFVIDKATPADERLRSLRVNEETLNSLSAGGPDILWPTVRSGKTKGVLSMYISVDRSGHVREAWPLNSDNAGLNDPAREQVKHWVFKSATDGAPVQVEAVLTLPFKTEIGDPISILTDEQARALATKIVEPNFPSGVAPSGTEVKIQIGVSLDGSVNGAGNPYNVPTNLFIAAAGATRQWHFSPYLRNGKADLFGADIVFHVP